MSGIRHDFDKEEARNEAFKKGGLEAILRRLLRFANTRITARSQTRYMQDAGFAAGRSRSRRPRGLPGPIRILTGRIFRAVGQRFSVRGGDGREGSVVVRVSRAIARMIKTVSVPYASAHEFGFKGVVSVPEHSRRISTAFGKPIAPRRVQVRAHSRRMDIKKRPFLWPALRDEADNIQREGGRLLVRGLSGQSL